MLRFCWGAVVAAALFGEIPVATSLDCLTELTHLKLCHKKEKTICYAYYFGMIW
jgi:hypothetical protein